MPIDPTDVAFDRPVPLFPLPNVVLFPGTTQSLHIFEPRYREMVADTLGQARLIAMALLEDDYVEHYHTNHAAIHPIVCVGHIREHVQLPDGRYFVNLEGICRARVLSEDRDGPYRLALLEQLSETGGLVDPDGAITVRHAIEEVLKAPSFDSLEGMDTLRSLLRADVPIGRAVDILAFKLVPADEVETKQQILEELDVVRRGSLLLAEIRSVKEILDVREVRRKHWPWDEGAN
jgi:Lon protease-like protein